MGPRKIGCPGSNRLAWACPPLPQQWKAPLELGPDRKPLGRAGGPVSGGAETREERLSRGRPAAWGLFRAVEGLAVAGAERRGRRPTRRPPPLAADFPEEAWDWIEERPRLGSGKSKELEKSPRTTAGARPKEWSLQVRRGRRRLRTGRSTPWRIPRHTDMRVDTTDSEGGRSVRARPRRGQEGKSPHMSENGGAGALRRVDENHETPENIPKRHDDTRGSPSRAVKVDIVTSIERDGPWECG
ncbi:hypothetical protein NDU88_005596 [Pleurodeles waltl]|uniref:Uncharacterized protein n=1 Tax=Pleurodeles waltl TaxID=8319 RepID=A0AAV7TVW8_PLEWA|nr:hypothetical protein NDU88_005596 [Pleurodeles waltl]